MIKANFYAHVRKDKIKTFELVSGKACKVRVKDETFYFGIYPISENRREYFVIDLNTGLSFGKTIKGSYKKAVSDTMIKLNVLNKESWDYIIDKIKIEKTPENSDLIYTLSDKKYFMEVDDDFRNI